MKMKIALLLCTVFLLHSLTFKTFSQSLQISGKATSRVADESLPGATVSVNGGGASVITGAQGSFTITVPKTGVILMVTYAGMVPAEWVLTGVGVQHFQLEAGNNNLEDVVVAGYETQKKTSLTASVSFVKGGAIQRQPVADLTKALSGRAAGILFTQASRQAGNDASHIIPAGYNRL